MAIFAIVHGMRFGEAFPMFSLVGREDAGAFAEGANTIQGRQNGGTDELRAILHPLHRPAEGLIDLKGDNVLFFGFGHIETCSGEF